MRKEFAVTAPSRDPRWLLGLMMGLPMLLALLGVGLSHGAPRPATLLVAVLVGTVFLAAFLVLGWATKRRAIAIDNGSLDVLATFYRRRVPMQDFDLDKARTVDLREHGQWRPLLQTNGYALPGLYAGWFRSRDWTSLFCMVTDRQRVLVLPLRDGGAVLLSAERPAELLNALRAEDDGQRGRR